MNKIKVLFLVEDFKIGGLERVVAFLYDGLNKEDFDPAIWCLAEGGHLAQKFFKDKKNIRILNLKSYYNPLNILKLSFYLRKGKFQIVHTHGYFAGTFGRMAAYLAETPIILAHVHTTDWSLSFRNIIIDRMLSRITDRIICCSNAVREFLIDNERIDNGKDRMVSESRPGHYGHR
jgi:hypothetical protein